MSDFNVGQVLVPGINYFSSGTYPTSYTLAQAVAAATLTGSTGKTVLASTVIPAGQIQTNDTLRVTAYFSCTSSANNKTGYVTLGQTDFGTQVVTTVGGFKMQTNIRMRTQQSQVSSLQGPVNGSGQALATGTADMTQAQTLTISGQLASGAESIQLLFYSVQVVRASVSSSNVTYGTSQIVVPAINQYLSNNYPTTYSVSESGSLNIVSATTAETTLASITIPANTLAATDALVVSYSLGSVSNANNKTYRLKLGGTTLATTVVTTNDLLNNFYVIQANSSTSSQVALNSLDVATGTTVSSLDLTQAQTLTITGQLADANDFIELYSLQVEVWRT